MKTSSFRFDGSSKFQLKNSANKVDDFYADKKDYEKQLLSFQRKIDELQSMMYAHNRYGMLVIFQAMDAAGKDSAIKNVMSGVNPHGVRVFAFKRPSDTELDHDFLWRTTACLPERGNIHIFNRSYYEEVLIVKVHPTILQNNQRLPEELTENLEKVWEKRYADICNFEQYLHQNGIRVVKFFLNVSKEEQAAQFLERLEDPTKNWKFAEADLKEREHWDSYMEAYEQCINATSSATAPWYVIPADDKKNARLLISQILVEELSQLKMNYPTVDAARMKELEQYKEVLRKETKA